jgi:hypothetical protein
MSEELNALRRKKRKTMKSSLSVPLYELTAIQSRMMNLAVKTSQKQLQMISSMTRVETVEIVFEGLMENASHPCCGEQIVMN